MKSKLFFCSLVAVIFLLPVFVLADEASTTLEVMQGESVATPNVVSEEISTTTDTDLNPAATTTENGLDAIVEGTELSVDTATTTSESDETVDAPAPVDEVPVGTYISGDLTENQTWTKENGPYYISDIYIPNGVAVTVEEGTEIHAGGYIAVFGNLTLKGTNSDKIITDLDPNFSNWSIYVDIFANLNFTGVSINHVDGITTNNGFIHFTDVDYLNPADGIVLQNFGSFVGERINFQGGDNGIEILAIDNSTINLRDSSIDSGAGENRYMIQGYRGCKINISNTKILTKFSTPIIMQGGQLDMDTVSISGGDDNGIELYVDRSSGVPVSTEASIINTTISDFSSDGIFAISPNIKIVASKIINNDVGIEFYIQSDTDLSVTNSTVVGNITGVVFSVREESEDANINLDFRDNWWGDETGPLMVGKNDGGFGDEIVGYTPFARSKIQFDPWLLKEPNKKNPVIIIPGIMGSYLNKDDENKTEVWPNLFKAFKPGEDSYLDDLIIDSLGSLGEQNNIISKDVFRIVSFFGKDTDFFGALISKLKSDGYEEGKDLFVFPYDWRLDVADNVNGNDDSQVESLNHKIDEILKESKSDKVDIVAHSMGGLLSKYYIKHVGTNKVDKFIDIGTPHLGAPKAEKVLMYGDDMDIKFGALGLNPDEIKKISQNFPSAYNLLPSKKYFDSSLGDYTYYLYDLGDVDGDGVMGRLSYNDTKTFLENSGRNKTLIENAELVHNDLDDFNPSDYGVQSYNIVGCGTPTIGKIFANKKQFDGDYKYQLKYITGDGTVPERSAEGMSSDKLFYATGVEHATMPSQGGIRNLIASILKDGGDGFDYSSNPSIHTDTSNCKIPDGKIISIHSPIALNIYDNVGHRTGPDINGDIEYGVEGVTYDILDGNKFTFIPNTIHSTIKFNATGTGTAGVDVQAYKNGEIIKSESFENVPITSLNTKGEVVVDNGGSKILLDRNGNGQVETLLPTHSVEGDFQEEPAPDSKPVVVVNSVSVVSGSQIATTSLNIQTFKYLNKEPEKITSIPEDEVDEIIVDRVIMSSTTSPEKVKLGDVSNSQLASPAGFFVNIVSVVWKFLLELFNKIINLFK